MTDWRKENTRKKGRFRERSTLSRMSWRKRRMILLLLSRAWKRRMRRSLSSSASSRSYEQYVTLSINAPMTRAGTWPLSPSCWGRKGQHVCSRSARLPNELGIAYDNEAWAKSPPPLEYSDPPCPHPAGLGALFCMHAIVKFCLHNELQLNV